MPRFIHIAAPGGGGGPSYGSEQYFSPDFSSPAGSFQDDITYGVRFDTDVDGRVTGGRLYVDFDPGGDPQPDRMQLWEVGNSTPLADVAVSPDSSDASGWEQFSFPAPILVTAGTDYELTFSASSPDAWWQYQNTTIADVGDLNEINSDQGRFVDAPQTLPDTDDTTGFPGVSPVFEPEL